jgi:hypothetical protein
MKEVTSGKSKNFNRGFKVADLHDLERTLWATADKLRSNMDYGRNATAPRCAWPG